MEAEDEREAVHLEAEEQSPPVGVAENRREAVGVEEMTQAEGEAPLPWAGEERVMGRQDLPRREGVGILHLQGEGGDRQESHQEEAEGGLLHPKEERVPGEQDPPAEDRDVPLAGVGLRTAHDPPVAGRKGGIAPPVRQGADLSAHPSASVHPAFPSPSTSVRQPEAARTQASPTSALRSCC